jgi:hypothetical protein
VYDGRRGRGWNAEGSQKKKRIKMKGRVIEVCTLSLVI